METSLVTSKAGLLPESAPLEIVFIPEGSHRITPQSHPKGITVNLPPHRGQEIVARLQKSLENRLQQNVKPWFDFEHTRRFPAAGYPTAFRYEAGKGIIATVEWSASGSKAIEGRDVRYFSPEFHVDTEGFPVAIPEKGPAGGLVTEPAFREITPLAASHAKRELSGYELVMAHFATELGEESQRGQETLAATEDLSSLSPYEKVSAHFAKELGETEDLNREKLERVAARQKDENNLEKGLTAYERISAHFAAELQE